VAICATWVLVGCLSYARHYLTDREFANIPLFGAELLTWLACFFPWAIFMPAIFQFENRFPLSWRNAPLLAAAGPVFCLAAIEVWVGASTFTTHVLGGRLPAPTPRGALNAGEFSVQALTYISALAVAYVIRNLNALREWERESARLAIEKARLQADLKTAELANLRMRTNPHFLFNALQNISALTQVEPRTASRMLARLGDLLRVSFRRETAAESPLETEIELTQAYLEIEQMRMGNALTIRFEIEDGTKQALAPTLILQPLVENAIKHGFRHRLGGTLVIRSARRDDRLILIVADDGVGIAFEDCERLHFGCGLGTTRERLERMYPGVSEISLRPRKEGGTEVCVLLPYRLGEARSMIATNAEVTGSYR